MTLEAIGSQSIPFWYIGLVSACVVIQCPGHYYVMRSTPRIRTSINLRVDGLVDIANEEVELRGFGALTSIDVFADPQLG